MNHIRSWQGESPPVVLREVSKKSPVEVLCSPIHVPIFLPFHTCKPPRKPRLCSPHLCPPRISLWRGIFYKDVTSPGFPTSEMSLIVSYPTEAVEEKGQFRGKQPFVLIKLWDVSALGSPLV